MQVLIPQACKQQFLSISDKFTNLNKESLASMLGERDEDAHTITVKRLFFPQQVGAVTLFRWLCCRTRLVTAATVRWQAKEASTKLTSAPTMGWCFAATYIHTWVRDLVDAAYNHMHRHPQHDNFLSSIDVHQLYVDMQQNTLNVSVVYSPISENQWQAYTLTDYGR
jgi:hypothetical protein